MKPEVELVKRICCPAIIVDDNTKPIAWNVFAVDKNGNLRKDLLNSNNAITLNLNNGQTLFLFVDREEDGARKFLHDLNNSLSAILQSAELLERLVSVSRLESELGEYEEAYKKLIRFLESKRIFQLVGNIKSSCAQILNLTSEFRSLSEITRKQEMTLKQNGKHILMIEDDKAVGEAIKLLLSDRGGFEVVLAESADRALKVLSGWRFAAIVLDWYVPGSVSGEELLAKINSLAPNVPIIVLSGDDTVLSQVKSDSRVAATVAKPITDFSKFLSLITSVAKGENNA